MTAADGYFQDGTTEVSTFGSDDWFNGINGIAFIARGRVTVATLNVNNVGTTNPRLYARDITLANTTSMIVRIKRSLGFMVRAKLASMRPNSQALGCWHFIDFCHWPMFNVLAPAGLVSDLQQALLSLIANVTQQMQICSWSCSISAPLRGLI